MTKEKAYQFQKYYMYAIVKNKGDIEQMRAAIFATLFHNASTDESPHHTRCPAGPSSWCFYKKALARNEAPPSHADNINWPITKDVAQELLPVYQRMADPNLLKRLAKGKTQNANECLHSVIWSKCPKTVFVGKQRLDGAVASAVSVFNAGATHITQVMERLGLEVNDLSTTIMQAVDNTRIMAARRQSQHGYRTERKLRADVRKTQRVALEREEGVQYAPGHF